MHSTLFTAAALWAQVCIAYPFVASMPGVDSSLLRHPQYHQRARQAGSASGCPFNADHKGAVPISAKYPYCGAINGVPGKQKCINNFVPAPGDTAHYYTPPGKNDIRGPCPGLNTATNHNFLSHDGITTFTELVDMQQNVYGVGYDLAVLLTVVGLGLDGDPVTEKLSIGCDATSRTAAPGLGPELGLDGHNKFEADASLTRNDYFLANGDNYSFNKTLFDSMSRSVKGNYSRDQLSLYRAQRYNESRATNPHFFFDVGALLLYGAASFLYELFPIGGSAGLANDAIQHAFFIDEKLPKGYYSRSSPYTAMLVGNEISAMYQKNPVQFGGNVGKGNFQSETPDSLSSLFQGGFYNGSGQDSMCLLYQFATENIPSSIGGVLNRPISTLIWAASKLNPVFSSNGYPCPLNYNNA